MLTLWESFYQAMLTYLELISNIIHTFTELFSNSSIANTFLRISMDTCTDRTFLKRRSPSKSEKLVCTHEADNFAINYSWVYMIGHSWLFGRNLLSPPLPKRKLDPSNTEFPQEIWNLPSPKLQVTKKNFTPHKKRPKMRNCRNDNWNHFFCMRFVFPFFILGGKSHLKKITHT